MSSSGHEQRPGATKRGPDLETAEPSSARMAIEADDEPRASSREHDSVPRAVRRAFRRLPYLVQDWLSDPDFSIFFVVFMVAAVLLYLRPPSGVGGGFVFDEQEAILANPFVRGKQPWIDALRRDFWGRLPDASIGSYRPVPNLLWRLLWRIQEWRSHGGGVSNTPFVWFNLVFHATNAALLACFVRTGLGRVGIAWLAGGLFCGCAILTEAVSGIVGIADVLGGLSVLLALGALTFPAFAVLPLVFVATFLGLLSKESAVVNVGLVPLAALCLGNLIARSRSQFDDDRAPLSGRLLRASLALIGALAALGAYFVVRHHYFHVNLVADAAKLQPVPWSQFFQRPVGVLRAAVNLWSEQLRLYIGAPNLPVDPFNNPLADPTATPWQRIAGGLRVYFRGFGQLLFPHNLSPDYSTPQEPLPPRLFFPESIGGAILLVVPPIVGAWLTLVAHRKPAGDLTRSGQYEHDSEPSVYRRTRLALLGYALMAWPLAFFPLSNIPKVLPTVRAERFWYTPALATSVVIAVLLAMLAHRAWIVAATFATALLTVQCVQAIRHAHDFRDDLAFWESAASAVPNSAKAHLNFSVMLGARGVELRKMTYQAAQEARLVENVRATELAPKWDMAFIYVGDTLCQLNRMEEAWAWYVKGFRLGPQNSGLIALALQCLSDKNYLLPKQAEATALADEPSMHGSWLAYLVHDTLDRERKCRGVEPASTVPLDGPLGGDELGEWMDPDTKLGDTADSAAASTDATTSAAAAPSASTQGSTTHRSEPSPRATASAGGPSTTTSASGSASITASSGAASASASASAEPPAPPAAPSAPLPPCGVDPKYRPRGLDGDPKND